MLILSKYAQILRNMATVRAVKQCRGALKIVVGSASLEQPGWISTDYPLLDLTAEATFLRMFGSPGSVNNFLAEHVWEHLTGEQASIAAANCFSYLTKGGKLRLAVPDGFHPDSEYIAQVRPNGMGPGADDHKTLYNYQTFSDLLAKAGFQVELLEWFDATGQFNSKPWDPQEGMIRRSSRFDPRNQDRPLSYTSLIVDAVKL